jgi:predicted SAM-dependent methyltransferase
MNKKKEIGEVLKKNNKGISLDIGCGENKQPGCVGIDVRSLDGVDIVHDLQKFPWPLPTESVSFALASHLIEHFPKGAPDPKLVSLVKLLVNEGIVSQKKIDEYLGEVNTGFALLRFFDEVWRIMKPGGQLVIACPYGGSQGFYQDPSHLSGVVPAMFAYLDPLVPNSPLYEIYRPLPWKIVKLAYDTNGNIETCLEKRVIDPSYKVLSKISK